MPRSFKTKNGVYSYSGFQASVRAEAKKLKDELKLEGKKARVKRNGNKFAVFYQD